MSDFLKVFHKLEFYYLDGVITCDHCFENNDGDIVKLLDHIKPAVMSALCKYVYEKQTEHKYKVVLKVSDTIKVVGYWDFDGHFSSDFNHVLIVAEDANLGDLGHTYCDSDPLIYYWSMVEAKRILKMAKDEMVKFSKDYFKRFVLDVYNKHREHFYMYDSESVNERLGMCK